MQRQKLGCYSFVIDTNELGLVSGESVHLTRDQLPDHLKPLFDIMSTNMHHGKPICIQVKGLIDMIAYCVVYGTMITCDTTDGNVLTINQDDEYMDITIYVY